MGKRFVLVDDLDGKELPDDTKPVVLSLGRTTYNLYLSEDNHGKLLKALDPFITDAETTSSTAPAATGRKASNTDKERNKAVRAWAQSTGFKYEGADGEERTLGDRGQIPPVVYEAYDLANG